MAGTPPLGAGPALAEAVWCKAISFDAPRPCNPPGWVAPLPMETFDPLDLHTIETIIRTPTRDTLASWRPGDAWLAGGSWLFSEPQPHLDRLLDLNGFGWPPITVTPRPARPIFTSRSP